MKRILLFVLACLLLVVPEVRAATITFLEPGGDASSDISLWGGGATGTNTATTNTTFNGQNPPTGPRMIRVSVNGNNTAENLLSSNGIMADAGRRLSFRFNTDALSIGQGTPGQAIFDVRTSGAAAQVLAIGYQTDGTLTLFSGASSKASTTKLTVTTWNRISLGYVITGVSNWSATLYFNGTSILSASNSDFSLGSASSNMVQIGPGTVVSAPVDMLYDDFYIDDGTDKADVGNIKVTSKLPASSGANNAFDTAIGSCSNRWDCVDERPLSIAKGWEHAAASSVLENYGIQASNVGDVDLTGATQVGFGGWVYGREGNVATTPIWTSHQTTTSAGEVANDNSCANKTGTNSTCVTAGQASSAVVRNNLCIAAFADLIGGTAPTISDNLSNSWTALSGPTTSTVRLSWWFSVITSPGQIAVTVTHDAVAAAQGLVVNCFADGAISATPKDVNPTNTTNATSTYSAPASGTLAQANEVVVGVFAFNGPTGDTTAAANGYSNLTTAATTGTSGGSASTNVHIYMDYLVVTATTSTTPQATNSTNRAGVQGTVSFKRTAATAGTAGITVNGSTTTPTFPSTADGVVTGTYTTSGTYPNNSATIGMQSNSSGARAYFYEGGILIAYTPRPGAMALTGAGLAE